MDGLDDLLESFWDELLSRDPQRIQAAFAQLTEAERAAVVAHLRQMVAEPGWHPEQRASAQAGLAVVGG